MAEQIVREIFGAIRGQGSGATKIVRLYPIVAAGSAPAGVALPHDNNLVANNYGVWTQILLAVAAPVVEFWYCGYQIMVSAAAGVQSHKIQVGTGLVAGPPVLIHEGCDAPGRAAAAEDSTIFNEHKPTYPIYQPAATPISGRSAVTAKIAAANITTCVLLGTGF